MQHTLDELKRQGLLRGLSPVQMQGAYLLHDGQRYLNLSSNDYLGLTARLDLQRRFLATLPDNEFVLGTPSSRLLTGTSDHVLHFEEELSALYGARAALVFNSGCHANSGILPAIAHKGDLILADRLVHASIIDGLRLGAAEFKRYRHNDYDDLQRRLQCAHGHYNNIFIVTESVFSMDGDIADIDRLVALKQQYQARLYIDEAHAFGVFGEHGLGLVAAQGLTAEVDYILCTLGKAAASEGAFIICSADARQWLINRCRSLIYTTAQPVLNVLWSHFIVREIAAMQTERMSLLQLADTFRSRLRQLPGLQVLGSTQIIPLVTGDNASALALAQALQRQGIWAMPVRPPTVPNGSARVRFSLNAALNTQQIQQVYETIVAHTQKA